VVPLWFRCGPATGLHSPGGLAGWKAHHAPSHTAAASGRRLGLGSPPHSLSSSVRLDWLPNGDLRAVAPEMRGDLQGFIRPLLQTSQSMTSHVLLEKVRKKLVQIQGMAGNGGGFHRTQTGWQGRPAFTDPKVK